MVVAVILAVSLAPGSTPSAAAGHGPGATASRAKSSPSTRGPIAVRDLILTAPNSTGVNVVSFSSDSALLADSSPNGRVYVWNLASGQLTRTLAPPGGAYIEVFSPVGMLLAAGGGDHIWVWNAATGHLVASLIAPEPEGAINALAFSSDGRFLAVGNGSQVVVWDVATGAMILNLTATSSVDGVAFSPGGTLLAAVSILRGPVFLWDVATGKSAGTLSDGWQGGYQAVTFNPDGKLLATAGGNGISLWSVASHRIVSELAKSNIQEEPIALAFSPDGKVFTLNGSAPYGQGVSLFDVATGTVTDTIADPGENAVWGVAFSPNDKLLAFVDNIGEIFVEAKSQSAW